MNLLFSNGLVLTGQPASSRRADVLVEDDVITAVSDHLSAPTATTIDCSNKLLTPGFINGHIHLSQVLNRGFLDDLSTERLLQNMHARHSLKNEDDRYWGALLSLYEGLRSGTTYFAAFATAKGNIASAMEDAGVRGTLTIAKKDQWWGNGTAPPRESFDEIIGALERESREWTHSRISLSLGAASDRAASRELLLAVRRLASLNNSRIFIHVSEGDEAVALSKQLRGSTPIAFLDSIGFLADDVTLVHATCASDADLRIVRDSKASICHCPISNAKSGAGTFPAPKALEMGIPIMLGTDAASTGNTNNVLLEAYATTLIHQATSGDPLAITAETAFYLLTIGAARALGDTERIGQIAPGFKADLSLWDLDQSAFLPASNPLHSLIYCASELRASAVYISGILVFDGLPTRFSLDSVRTHLRRYRSALDSNPVRT